MLSFSFDDQITILIKEVAMKVVLNFLFLVLISGCATVGGLQSGSGGSTFEVYGKSYDEVWRASVHAMSSNLTIVESDKHSGTIKSEARAGMATWGEVVGLFIRPTSEGADKYTVEVLSKKTHANTDYWAKLGAISYG